MHFQYRTNNKREAYYLFYQKMKVDARKEANRIGNSTKGLLGPMLRRVSNFVTKGVMGMAESANLHDEVGQVFYPPKDKICDSIEVHYSGKTMGRDVDQFKQIQESLRMKGCLTHFAIGQVLPGIIGSINEHNTQCLNKKQHNDNPIKINVFNSEQQRRLEPEGGKLSQFKHNKVLLKTEKDGTCTWIKRSENSSKFNPIRRRSVFETDVNRGGLQIKSFNARSA